MKIRIYAQDAEPFSAGGGSPLTPTRCEITANLNSDWTLALEHPLDADGMYKLIQSGAVLRVPAFNGSQLYRIITADRTDGGITATAEPIFMDALHDVFLLDSRPTNLSGQAALDYLMRGTKFSGQSDILNLNTAYYVRKNLIEALNGENENAFTGRWGGEILYNNYQVVINRSAGRDKGVVVKYGRNLTGITETVDRSSLITRIIPVGYDGIMLSGSAPWVDSPIIDSYPIIYNSVIEYSDVKVKEDPDDPDEEGFATLAEAQAELTRLANLEYSQNNVDKELVSMDVDLILLQNTLEYAEFKDLEDISLGDTVKCEHSKLGISTSARCISLTWDCITQRVTAVTLGQFKPNYFNTTTNTTNRVDQAITPSGTVVAEQVQGVLNAALTQLKLQNTVAQKQSVRAILFEDLDPNSPTYGAMSIGTQGFQIADERTADGLDWNWRTAATAKSVSADVIGAGTLKGVEILADKGTIGGWTINKDSISKTVTLSSGGEYTVTLYGNGQDKVIEIGKSGQDPQYILYSDGRSESMTQTVAKEMICSPLQSDWERSSPDSPFFVRCQYKGSYTVNSMALRLLSMDYNTYSAFATLTPYTDSGYNINLGRSNLPFNSVYFCNLSLYTKHLNGFQWTGEEKLLASDAGIRMYYNNVADRNNNPLVFSLWRDQSGYAPGTMSIYNVSNQSDPFISFRVDPEENELSLYNYVNRSRYVILDGTTGNANFHGAVTCSNVIQTSDRRLKKNINILDVAQCIAFIKSLEPVKFEFTDENDDKIHAGFVAQDVAEAQEELGVSFAEERDIPKNDPDIPQPLANSDALQTEWTINYSSIIAPLVSVVQSQQTEIEQLKKKLSELEAQIT